MKPIWRVALYEYRRNVFKKSFIVLLLSVPAFIAFSIGLGVFMESLEDQDAPVGYVDQAGVFVQPRNLNKTDLTFIAYESQAEAEEALFAEEVQVVYLIPPNYYKNRQVEKLVLGKVGENAQRAFFDFLQLNLMDDLPAAIAQRAAAGTTVDVRSVDGTRVVPSGGPTFGLLMPILMTIGFLFLILMSSGYTLSAVAEEKENRTMEVLVTSISTSRLIAGKIASIVAIGLTLLAAWVMVILIGIFTARVLGVGFFQELSLDWPAMLRILAIAIPTYATAVALMTAIGAMVTTTQEGQSISGIFTMLHMIPFYISWTFIDHPHSPIAVLLSLLPFTALMTTGMRNLFTVIPTWQILTSLGIQTICALGAAWLAGRALRLGMLRYGQRLTLRRLFRMARKKKVTI